jgi:arylformamidase
MTTFHTYWHPDVSIQQLGTISDEGRETREVTFGTHTGTHVDAPLHFVEGGASVEDLPLDALMGPVHFVDFTNLEENDPVTSEMLDDVRIANRMVFQFGWEDRWGDPDDFYYDYPYFTVGAAEQLVAEGVQLMGFDTPSPDASSGPLDGSGEDSPVHKVLLEAGIVLLEYLQNLDAVDPSHDWSLSALPLKIRGADGAPARVIVWRE